MIQEGVGKRLSKSVLIDISKFARRIAKAEAERRQSRDGKSTSQWKRGVLANPHYFGLLAEIAVAEWLGSSVSDSQTYDAGWDVKLTGLKIDVKTTTRDMPLLKVRRRQKCHLFVMTKIHEKANMVEVIGWCNYHAATNRPTTKGKGDWMNYVAMKRDELNDPETLRASVKSNLIRYPGGKSRLWSHLKHHLPRGDMFDPDTYVEPFLGGGAIFSRMLAQASYKTYHVNDIDKSLAMLWRCVKQQPAKLKAKVVSWIPNTDDWYAAKERDGITGDRSMVDVAMDKLILHYASHAGLGYMAGGPQGGKKQQGKYLIGCRWNPIAICKKISWLSRRMQQTEITSVCFSDIHPPDGSFVFADPPYMGAGNQLYRHGFSQAQHAQLKDWLENHAGMWALTYDDCEKVRKMYSRYRISEYANATGNNRKHTELLITNY